MPKSKRNKIVNLTKTKSKGRDGKQVLINRVQEACDAYPNVYVFHVKNMRNLVFKELRTSMQDTSKFFFGSNRVMAKALGETHEEEHKPGMMHVAKALVGEVGLLFSSLGLEEVKKEVAKHRTADFARGGGRAVRTVTLPEGPVRRVGEVLDEGDLDGETEDYVTLVGGESVLQPFPNNMETQLRDLGMPTLLKGGVILLMRPHTICTKGEILNPSQASLLKHFNLRTATFDVSVVGMWSGEEEKYTAFEVDEEALKEGGGEEMEEDEEEE